MTTTRWAILGPGDIGGWFARALPRSTHGTLHGIASSNPDRAAAFAAMHGAPVTGTYDEILARDDIDAVYISTVNTTHADLAVAALTAGKAVLCEKPVSTTAAELERVLLTAEACGLPFVEAFKHRFGPFARALDATVGARDVHGPLHLAASFGFAAGERTGRLFDPEIGGGAILDVGGYPVSLAVALAAAAGIDPADLTVTSASGRVGETGVDEHAVATITAAEFTAQVECSIIETLPRSALVTGSNGSILLPDAFGGRRDTAASFIVQAGGRDRVVEVPTIDPFAAEADAVSLALLERRTEAPEMPWSYSRSIAGLLDDWRAGLDR